MAWKEPKINWTGSDAVTNDDFNRIEGNTKDLKDNKVDKVAGKGLSSADFTQAEKDKLAGIASGANKYIHPSTHPASMITGLPTSLPANGGNADTVDGKHATDFVNAVASGSTSDPNTTQLPYILTNHANSPGLGKYWHIQTLFYSSKTGNRAQIAVDYNHSGGYMYIRHYYGGSWTSWKKVWTQDTDGSGSSLDADTVDGKHVSDLSQMNSGIWSEYDARQIPAGGTYTKTIPLGFNAIKGRLFIKGQNLNEGAIVYFDTSANNACSISTEGLYAKAANKSINGYVTEFKSFGYGDIRILDTYISSSNLVIVFKNEDTANASYLRVKFLKWEVEK